MRSAFDATLSEPVEATWWRGRHRTKRLHDAEEQLAQAVQERFAHELAEIREQIKILWTERAREAVEDFNAKAEIAEQANEKLKTLSVTGAQLLGVPYPISFKAFCESNGGESAFSVWCHNVERELKPARTTSTASVRDTAENLGL